MTSTTARIKREGKHFEIMVDMEKALEFKKGGDFSGVLESDKIFSDSKKGEVASNDDLQKAFKTTDVNAVAEEIVKKGEVLVDQGHRSAEQEQKIKQVVDYLVTNAVDPQTGNPHTGDRIKGVLEQAQVNIKNIPIDEQIQDIVASVEKILPLKFDTKKVKITVPAQFASQVYGILKVYKESENWNNDGSLDCVVKVPAGVLMNFYDKLNSVTHGSALTEEIQDE